MMYCEKFVVCIKVNGKILRENKDIVHLPFGTEYSILLKNLSSKRAKVNVFVDGDDVLDCSSILLGAHDETELEGFLKGFKVSNKFKFIEKTEKISDYRGDKAEDGLVRVEYSFEESDCWCPSTYIPWWTPRRESIWPDRMDVTYRSEVKTNNTDLSSDVGNNQVFYSSHVQDSSAGKPNVDPFYSANVNINSSVSENELGITVKGSKSSQNFVRGSIGSVGEKNIIILKLTGYNSKTFKIIKKPVLVKQKIECPTCGTKSKSNINFCPECGTALF